MSAIMHRTMIRRAGPRTGPRFDPWLICAALLALIPIYSIVQPGVPHTADGEVHLLRTLEVVRLLREGVFYPRWAPDFYLGYGYPFFNFYAPGAHLLAGWLALTGLGVLRSVVAVQVIALLLYPTGAYLAARSLWEDGPAALVCAALYLYAPLRWRELFVQGNLSQLLALAWLPWCAWMLTRAVRWGSYRWAAGAGAALAGLVYAHHPSAFLAFPLLAVYAGVWVVVQNLTPQAPLLGGEGEARRRWEKGAGLLPAVVAFAVALALAAPFWGPALAEMRYVNINAIDTGSFNAGLNLLPLRELLALPAVQDAAALNPPMPNSLGIVQVVFAAAGLLAAVWVAWSAKDAKPAGAGAKDAKSPVASGALPENRGLWRLPHFVRTASAAFRDPGGSNLLKSVRREDFAPSPLWRGDRRVRFVLIAIALMFGGCVALMLPGAAPVWAVLPLARLIAFPWRLLGPALLFAALLGSAWVVLLPARWRVGAAAVALVVIPIGMGPYLFPRPFDAVTEPDLAGLARYETSGGARATASANEYLPMWVHDANPPADDGYAAGRAPQPLDPAQLPAGSRAAAPTARGLSSTYALTLTEASTIQFHTFYFPGWQATVDGQPVAITPSGPYGLIQVAVPAGAHEVRLRFADTPIRAAANGAFAVGLAACIGLWLWAKPHPVPCLRGAPFSWEARGAGDDARGDRTEWWAVVVLSAVALGVAVVTVGFVGPHTGWFRDQSPVAQPAAMQHAVHAQFANGVELLGYDLTETQVRQGDVLRLRLYWRPLQHGIGDAHPFIHVDSITGESTWAAQDKDNPGDKPMSGWVPGFYVVDDYQVQIPADAPPVLAMLHVGLLVNGRELVPVAGGQDLADLQTVHILPRQAPNVAALPDHAHSYRLGDNVLLLGYEAQLDAARRGVDLTLYWQAARPVAENYSVFVHVTDAAGNVLGQWDGPPVNGWYPSDAWLPEQIIADRRHVPLSSAPGAGGVRAAVGLYTLDTGQRAAVRDDGGARQADDQVVIEVR
jgi:hypothetical protein